MPTFRALVGRMLAVLSIAAIPLGLTLSGGRAALLAQNTLLLAGSVAAISVVLGAPLALLLVRTDLVGRGLLATLLVTMLLVPVVLQTAGWQAAFGVQGWITRAASLPPLQGWLGAIGVHVLAALPWVVLIVGVGLWSVETELEQDALLDTSPLAVCLRVTLRRAWPSVVAALLWVAAATAGDMTVTDVFQVRTYAEEIYTQLAIGDEPPMTWQALPSILAVAWLVVAALVATAQLVPHDAPTSYCAAWQFRLGRWRWPASAAAWSAVLIVIGIPLASLIAEVGLVVTPGGDGWTRSWSAAKGLAIVASSPWRLSRELKWSLMIGSLAAAAAVAIAYPLAWRARRGGLAALAAWLVAAVAVAIPGPLVGLGLITLLNRPEYQWLTWLYDRSILSPWLALLIKGLPAAILILWHALRTLPDEQVQAAAVDAAPPWATFRRIVLPARWPALLAAYLVALALAIGELPASILVVPPGVTTLAIEIFGLIHYGVNDVVAGISLALVAAVLVLGVLILTLGRWTVRNTARYDTAPDGPAA